MQNLYNELINGTVEYKDGGHIIQHPPTALALRAARMLKQLVDTNDTNGLLIRQLQAREEEVHRNLEITEAKIEKLQMLLQEAVDKGISVENVIKNFENLPPAENVDGSEPVVETTTEVVDESSDALEAPTETQTPNLEGHNMFEEPK